MRTFLKKSSVPSVFPWMKSKTQAQLDGEKREQKRHESKVLRLAEQWSTDKAKKAEEEEENKLYADEAFHIAAEETRDFADSDCPPTAASPGVALTTGEAENLSEAINANNVCGTAATSCMRTNNSSCSLPSFFFPTAVGTTQDEASAQELERNPPIPNNIAEDDDGGNHSTSAGGAWQEPYLCVNAIKHSDKFVHFYTGLENYFVFLHAFWSLGDNVNHLKFAYSGKCDCISPENQFLLMLVKLRRHYPHTELARMFNVSNFTVQNVFVT